jgi:hypothetical protein
VGRYIYADYCTGEIWKLKYEGGVVTEDAFLLSAGTSILSFGEDQNHELYILGDNGIIYRFNQSTATGVAGENPASPAQFLLKQNYPNPFNPTTTISFALPAGTHAVLGVYDILGRKVATLVDGYVNAGIHQREFNAANLSSGVYLYRLSTPGYTQTKAMLLSK